MLQELSEKSFGAITARLDALAAKLGVAADHFWPLLVKREARSAQVTMVAELVWLAMLGASAELLFREAGKTETLEAYVDSTGEKKLFQRPIYDMDGRVLLRAGAVFCIGIIIVILGFSTYAWTAMLNPEATALLRLLGK